MTTTQPSLANSIDGFLRACAGKNRSPQTIRAYRTDVGQFVTWLQEENSFIQTPADITTEDVLEYLGALAHRNLSGVSRRRKLAAIREFFRYAKQIKAIAEDPAEGIDTPNDARPAPRSPFSASTISCTRGRSSRRRPRAPAPHGHWP